MVEINHSVLAAAAALVLTAGAASALTNDANTKAALATLEKSAYDAWKSEIQGREVLELASVGQICRLGDVQAR